MVPFWRNEGPHFYVLSDREAKELIRSGYGRGRSERERPNSKQSKDYKVSVKELLVCRPDCRDDHLDRIRRAFVSPSSAAE